MPQLGPLTLDAAEVAVLDTGKNNSIIKEFLENIEKAATLSEVSLLVAEMLRSLIEKRRDPGTVKDFKPVLAVLIAASDNTDKEESISQTTRLAKEEIVKKLKSMAELETGEMLENLSKTLSLLTFCFFNDAKVALNHIALEDRKYQELADYLTAIAEGAKLSKMEFSAKQYEEEAVTPLLSKMIQILYQLAPQKNPNALLSDEKKAWLLSGLQELQYLEKYHPNPALRKEAKACFDMFMASQEIASHWRGERLRGD